MSPGGAAWGAIAAATAPQTELEAASENPGPFAHDAETWVAATLGVDPA